MAFLSTTSSASGELNASTAPRKSARAAQALAKQKAWEKKSSTHKVKMATLAVFTQQLASMLDAGLSLVVALEALQEQVEDPIFRVILRNVKLDISTGTSFSEATKKYPNAFPNLFISMVEAGEASGGLAEILAKVADYFEASVKLNKKVKSAMTYPVAVIGLAVILVNVLLIFVIPVFAEMFADFGAELPKPTQFLINVSNWLKSNIFYCIIAAFIGYKIWGKLVKTPRGRAFKDRATVRAPIFGNLIKKISLARFCRTYSTLLRSGVPILRALEIVAASSGRVQIEDACVQISKHISSGGQVSDVLRENAYFPSMVAHMLKAGESTGNVDGMMEKIADFYDTESDAIIASLTSLIEPILIVFLGVVVGGIVMAMFLPIFHLSSVVG